jgi:hypothetical protein
MVLKPGIRLGPYEITAGAGGMGEVDFSVLIFVTPKGGAA